MFVAVGPLHLAIAKDKLHNTGPMSDLMSILCLILFENVRFERELDSQIRGKGPRTVCIVVCY